MIATYGKSRGESPGLSWLMVPVVRNLRPQNGLNSVRTGRMNIFLEKPAESGQNNSESGLKDSLQGLRNYARPARYPILLAHRLRNAS